jgi:hypothetical protein
VLMGAEITRAFALHKGSISGRTNTDAEPRG